MTEVYLEKDKIEVGIDAVNKSIGLPPGIPESGKLSKTVDVGPIWQLIRRTEVDGTKLPYDVEHGWTIDSVGGSLSLTSTITGNEQGVRHLDGHLINAHSHPDPAYQSVVYRIISPKIVTMHDQEFDFAIADKGQYLEFIFLRLKGKKYPALVAVKTNLAYHQKANILKYVAQAVANEITAPFLTPEKSENLYDKQAKSRGFAIYRGAINPESSSQKPFSLVDIT